MKIIKLTRGKEAIIDDQDFNLVSQYGWRYGFGSQGGEYAATGNGKETPTIRMHRLIMGAVKGQEVDHINGNGFDNRRSNLRFVTHRQNNINRKMPKHNKSGYKGIKVNKSGTYTAEIYVERKHLILGTYKKLDIALLARRWGERSYFGKYARVNSYKS